MRKSQYGGQRYQSQGPSILCGKALFACAGPIFSLSARPIHRHSIGNE